MNRAWSISEIEYPESDGQPMGETPLHQSWIIRLLNLFQQRYRNQPQVYVASDLMVYYTPGNIYDVFVPDLIVLLQSDRRQRRVLKLWEEPSVPNFVLEVTSRSTRSKDEKSKRELYARLGIAEYFLFDPTHEDLAPSLQGYRLSGSGAYLPIEPDQQGRHCSEQTGIAFSFHAELQLVLHDLETGELLLTDVEAAERRADAERQARLRAIQQERQRRERAEQFAHAAEQQAEAERQRRERAEQFAHEAEQQAEAERQARLQAEARIAELEAELWRMRDAK